MNEEQRTPPRPRLIARIEREEPVIEQPPVMDAPEEVTAPEKKPGVHPALKLLTALALALIAAGLSPGPMQMLVLVTVLIGGIITVGITGPAPEPSVPPVEAPPPATPVDETGRALSALGLLMLVIAGALGFMALNKDVTVSTGYGTVNNLGLMSEREMMVIAAGFTGLGGIVLLGFGAARK